jgi:hypothetical protein
MPLSNHFVSSFSAWATQMGYPARVRRRLPNLLRELPQLLLENDARQDLVVRTLKNADNLHVNAGTMTCGVCSTNDRLVFYSVGPHWSRIEHLSRDRDTSDLLESFLFFAGQYVTRSRLVQAIGALALSYGVLCDFREADLQRRTLGTGTAIHTLHDARNQLDVNLTSVRIRTRKARELAAWMARLNTLDPYIHRAVFQYWRASCLFKLNFIEEAITALDGLASVAGAAMVHWGVSPQQTRRQLAASLGLPKQDENALERLYQLRCLFGAHPAASKWWDFAEMYGDESELFFQGARRLLSRLAGLEQLHRTVHPEPPSWSGWLAQNADMLLEAIWFTKTP